MLSAHRGINDSRQLLDLLQCHLQQVASSCAVADLSHNNNNMISPAAQKSLERQKLEGADHGIHCQVSFS